MATAVAVLAAPVVTALAIFPGTASATPVTLFVSAANGSPGNPDTSCATAKYTTISDALADATANSTVEVCNGTYDEQVTIPAADSGLTLEAASGQSPVIQPTSFSGNAVDAAGSGAAPGLGFPPAGTPIAALVAVPAGLTGVTVSGLTLDGVNAATDMFFNSTTPAPAGCGAAELAGGLVQGASATFSNDVIENIVVPPCDGTGAFTNGVFVQSPGSSTSQVTVTGSTISNFGKNGVACINSGTSCTVSNDTITGNATNATYGQNGVQIGPGGTGVVTGSTISDLSYTGPTSPPEPQSSYSSAVLLYAADGAFNGTGGQATLGNVTQVTNNTIDNAQIGVQSVDSNAYVDGNTIEGTVLPPGTSIGVFAVPCDVSCSALGVSPQNGLQEWVSNNTISATNADKGIWIGDPATGYTNPMTPVVFGNTISGAATPIEFGTGVETVPGPPTGVTAKPLTATAATVTWTAPDFTGSDGGTPLPITGYTVVPNPACATCTGTSVSGSTTSATVGGLTPGVPYTFTVFATNAAGPGPSSAPSNALSPTTGYWLVASDGGVFSYGNANFYGSTGSIKLNQPVVGMAATHDGGGYWLVASDGGIFSYGDANFYGSTGSIKLNKPVVGMAATPDGGGYWLVASDGGIFNYGDAKFFGSTGSIKLNKPVVGMAATPDGGGYWLVASDGGIFSYGDAKFFGSTGSITLNKPVVGMAATHDGNGYWLVASDGGVFSYGDAKFFGSTGSIVLNKPVVGMSPTPDGNGYWLDASDGGIFNYGDAPFYGSTGNIVLNKPMVGMATT